MLHVFVHGSWHGYVELDSDRKEPSSEIVLAERSEFNHRWERCKQVHEADLPPILRRGLFSGIPCERYERMTIRNLDGETIAIYSLDGRFIRGNAIRIEALPDGGGFDVRVN